MRMGRGILLIPAMALAVLASLVALLALAVGPAQGAVHLLPGFTQSRVASDLTKPMDMEFAPDGRLFVVEQDGIVRIVQPNGMLATFLDISAKVDSTGERGLQSLTFDPNFATNHYVYLEYTMAGTGTTPVHNRIVRVTANGDVAVAGSEELIFRLNNQSSAYHMGGAIDFGKDGKLYISTGDNETSDNAQKRTNLFGKMLRINKDGTIPSSNPFYATASGKNRAIWALGLRNPFKFAVKPGTNTLLINDAGEHRWEEINRGKSGANYGWPVYEGPETDPKYTPPIVQYRHYREGRKYNKTGCAITGGTFYNPTTVQFPSGYVDDYFFADLCNGWIRRYRPATDKVTDLAFARGLNHVVDLEVSKGGGLYYLSRPNSSPGTSSVSKIRYTGN